VATVATFITSRFNTTESKPTFINPGCFGDDVAQWLAQELRADGVDVIGSPVPEDFGWALSFEVGGRKYWAVIGYQPGRGWYISLERHGFVALFGKRFRTIPDDVVDAVKRVLARGPDIQDVHWHSGRFPI
jgi:hypothetical protein